MLAVARFVPGTIDALNEQVKSLTNGQFDVYELDEYLHKLLDESDDIGF